MRSTLASSSSSPGGRSPAALRRPWLAGALTLMLCSAACARPGPGPIGWPQPEEAAQRAAATPTTNDEDVEGILRALEGRDVVLILDRFPDETPGKVRRKYRRAAQRWRRAGDRVGVLEWRSHVEDGQDVHTVLAVYRRRDRLRQLLFQWSSDASGRLSALTVRWHPWPDEIGEIAEDYISVNRFRMPLVGQWNVLQGGRTPDVNKHHNHPQQRWAFDMVVRQDGALRAPGENLNERHYGYGGTIVAPAPGTIIFARDGVHDNKVGTRGKLGGNGVVIDHGFGEYTAHWHMVPGTVKVHVGDAVAYGQELGKVGNSGRSTLPHLHVHLVSAGPGESPQALPLEFFEVVVDGVPARRAMPVRGQEVRHRTGEDPASRPDKRALFDL